MFKKTDKNLRNSIFVSMLFLSVSQGVFFFRDISYFRSYILEKANYHFFNENYFFAIRYFDKAVKLNGLDVDSYKDYAKALFNLENYDLAIKYFKLVVELEPYNFENYYSLSETLYVKSFITYDKDFCLQACKYLREAIDLNPNSEKLYLLIGLCYRECSLYKEARLFYNKALVYPKFSKASFYNLIGNTFKQEGLTNDALEYYKKTIDNNSHFFIAYYNIGDIYFSNKELDQALFWYKQSVKFSKKFIAGYMKIANLYYMNDDFDQARSWILEALKIDPDNTKLNYILGMPLVDINDKDEGFQYLKRALVCGEYENLIFEEDVLQ